MRRRSAAIANDGRVMLITSITLHTNVDDQGDKLTTVVDRNKLTTLTTLDVPRRKFSKFTVSNNVPEESRKLQIPFRHSVGQVEERLCQNDRSAVSTAHRLATDRQTDTVPDCSRPAR